MGHPTPQFTSFHINASNKTLFNTPANTDKTRPPRYYKYRPIQRDIVGDLDNVKPLSALLLLLPLVRNYWPAIRVGKPRNQQSPSGLNRKIVPFDAFFGPQITFLRRWGSKRIRNAIGCCYSIVRIFFLFFFFI